MIITLLIGTVGVFTGIGAVYYLSYNPPRREYIWVGKGENPVKHMRF